MKINEKLIDCYKKGEILDYTFNDTNVAWIMAGCLTNAQTEIFCTLVLSKSLKFIDNITINELILTPRGNNGYLIGDGGGYNFLTDANIQCRVAKINDNTIGFDFKKNSVFNALNNVSVSVVINKLKLTFN